MDLAPLGRRPVDDGLSRSIAAIVLVIAWVATWRPQVDPDAWWHIGLGRIISDTGALPSTEPFSWLTDGDRIVVHSWAWDVLMAGSFQVAGPTGTSLLVLPATALIVVLIWVLIGAVAPGLPVMARALLVLAAAIAALPTWAPRAQTLDVAFVLGTVLVLTRYLRVDRRNGLLAMPFVGILWANLHGSAILALVALIVLGLIANPLGARFGDWPLRPWIPLVAGGLAAIVGASVNPYGPSLFLYPFDRSVASAFIPEIVEWRPPELMSPALVPFTGLLGFTGLMLIIRPRARPDVFTVLVGLTWAGAALTSARFVTVAACTLVVAVAPPLASVVESWRRSTRGAVRDRRRHADRPARVAMTIVAALGIIAVGTTLIRPDAQDAAIRSRLPVAAVAELLATRCEGRLLADYGWGGYVIGSTGRSVGAYGDSAESPVRDQLAIEQAIHDPGGWLARYGVDIVMVPVDGPLSQWLDGASGWRAAYQDEQATIHVRNAVHDCRIGS